MRDAVGVARLSRDDPLGTVQYGRWSRRTRSAPVRACTLRTVKEQTVHPNQTNVARRWRVTVFLSRVRGEGFTPSGLVWVPQYPEGSPSNPRVEKRLCVCFPVDPRCPFGIVASQKKSLPSGLYPRQSTGNRKNSSAPVYFFPRLLGTRSVLLALPCLLAQESMAARV